MRYLVTGGAGFIGSNTVDELVRRGHSVVVLDDLASGKEDNLAEIRNKITFIKGSITDIEVVRKAMHEAEYVLHLAARTSSGPMLDHYVVSGIGDDVAFRGELLSQARRVIFQHRSSIAGDALLVHFGHDGIVRDGRFVIPRRLHHAERAEREEYTWPYDHGRPTADPF